MTRRCDRCRAEYESGADFGGHDYCMTCYTRIRQEEEQKRAAVERLKEQKVEYLRQQLREEYARQDKERGRKAKDYAEESRRLELLGQRKKPEDPSEEMRKRMKWGMFYLGKKRAVGEEMQIFTPLGRKKKPVSAQAPQTGAERATYAARGRLGKIGEKAKPKPAAAPIKQAELSLSAEGLPVSLSVGQKRVQVFLVGRNASALPVAVGLDASILDSQKSPIAFKAEPRTCTLPPEGDSKIMVEFDLPEDAARGRLSFSAVIKENAIYIDRQAAQSNAVSLSSQVKSPMDLQYRQGSAEFRQGALVLAFNNVGESGGILETSSTATYFPQEGAGRKASLSSRTKIKGGEKGIILSFAPAEGAAIAALELDLAGKDSNGKPYSLKKKISGNAPDAAGKKG
ncbi:MAG: hypothetical protein WC517_04640 [Patescibacteria group bacterium]